MATTSSVPDPDDDDNDESTSGDDQPADEQRVVEDSSLVPAEKETTITFDKESEKFVIFSAEGGIMRRLLNHDHAEGGGNPSGETAGVCVKLPIGCLSIPQGPRSSGGHADVVSRRVLDSNEGSDSDDQDDSNEETDD